ncbi:MAG TPA: recombinase RecA [Ardenticatenaceae bacterium]|jgi:recombination protein RecA
MVRDPGKDKALDAAMSQLRKRFGDGAIMKMGEAPDLQIEAIPTGSIALDLGLGIGGVPRGRIVEIYGPESSGKTTLCQHIIAEAQKLGGTCAFVDVEHAMDPTYAAKCGVDIDNLYISQPDTGEQALEIAEALIRSGAIDVVVIDSVAALVPRAEIEGEMGDSHVGLQARLMSQALRKLAGAVKKSNCCLIFTNQIRMKIGVLFGNPETTTGGNALKFYASVRMEIRASQPIKIGTDDVGKRAKVKIKKNKVAPPFRDAEFDIMFNEGISVSGDVLDVATEMEIVDKRGAYYSYGETRLGQGRENAKQFLQENLVMMTDIENQIRERSGLPLKALPVQSTLPLESAATPNGSDGNGSKPGKRGRASTASAPQLDLSTELEVEELEL